MTSINIDDDMVNSHLSRINTHNSKFIEDNNMSGPKLLDALRDFFDEKKKKQIKRVDDLLQIVTKLERYQKKLEKELSSETKKRRIKQLEAELKVVKKKCTKAHKLLKSL